MDYTRRRSSSPGSTSDQGSGGAPGKRTLVSQLQRKGAGARDAVQRSGGALPDAEVQGAAARGVETPTSTLPYADTIATAFGHHDVSGIAAHTGPEAAATADAMGAQAYATGDHVVLGAGADLHTVAHEAAHVVQQRAGVQLKGAVGEAGDVYEQHADHVADLVVAGRSAEAALDQHAGASMSAAPTVQRSLKVGSKDAPHDITAEFKGQHAHTSAEYAQAVINEIAKGVVPDSPFAQEFMANLEAIGRELAEWIEDTPGVDDGKSHPVYGREKQDRHYKDYNDLGKGLLGWIKSKGNRDREKQLAREVYANGVLDVYFSSLLYRTFLKIQNLHLLDPRVDESRRDAITNELSTGKSTVPGPKHGQDIGHYRHYFDSHPKGDQVKTNIPGGNMLAVLQNAPAFDVKNKVIVFHDLMEYFGNPRAWITPGQGEGLLPEPGADKGLATTAIDEAGDRTATTNDRGMAWPPSFNNATRNENEAGTQLARAHDIPLWAGQSMTTVRVENLAEWVGASKEEKTALAWAIFAFWHNDYDHTSQWAYHTLHETMDMAQNFGVDYNMLDREASLQTFTPDQLKQDLRTKWGALRVSARQALTSFGGLAEDDPRHASVKPLLETANQELTTSNAEFQAAGALPEAQQVTAAHSIMRHLTWCELNVQIARTRLGL